MKIRRPTARTQERAKKILIALKKLFPRAGMTLRYSNLWELLVAVELSAQCTDKKVNEVTEKLFKKYPRLEDYCCANSKEFMHDIFQTGFYHNKTKNILSAARMFRDVFHGVMPRTLTQMIMIPGVGRKTAHIVLGNAYGVVEGIAVDTHVARLAQVLRLSHHTNPDKIEQDLMILFPKKEWFRLTYRLIEYGRKYCFARRHNHAACPLSKIV